MKTSAKILIWILIVVLLALATIAAIWFFNTRQVQTVNTTSQNTVEDKITTTNTATSDYCDPEYNFGFKYPITWSLPKTNADYGDYSVFFKDIEQIFNVHVNQSKIYLTVKPYNFTATKTVLLKDGTQADWNIYTWPGSDNKFISLVNFEKDKVRYNLEFVLDNISSADQEKLVRDLVSSWNFACDN